MYNSRLDKQALLSHLDKTHLSRHIQPEIIMTVLGNLVLEQEKHDFKSYIYSKFTLFIITTNNSNIVKI